MWRCFGKLLKNKNKIFAEAVNDSVPGAAVASVTLSTMFANCVLYDAVHVFQMKIQIKYQFQIWTVTALNAFVSGYLVCDQIVLRCEFISTLPDRAFKCEWLLGVHFTFFRRFVFAKMSRNHYMHIP